MAEITIHYEGPIVSAREAFDAGNNRYFTGKPCVRGHIAQRQVKNGSCVVCARENRKAWEERHPGCRTEEGRKYRAKRPEVSRAASLAYRHRNLEQVRARQREAKQRIRAFDPEREKRQNERRKERIASKLAETAGRPRPSVCDICHKNVGRYICFDHCHASGEFRGWLCERCNKTLGLVKDAPVLLRRMAKYLERANDRIERQSPEEDASLGFCWSEPQLPD